MGWTPCKALWSKVHIETGWENALESALRERLSALEVGRVDIVRAFEQDAPPAKLAFYSLPSSAHENNAPHAAPPVGPVAPERCGPQGLAP
jgi:chromosome segregation protein